ncbi:MAG: ATP-binding protein [Myxococcota bacterium]
MDDRDLLRAVVDATSDAVFVKDALGRYVYVNGAALARLGKPIDEVLGRDDAAVFPSAGVKARMALDRAVLTDGQVRTAEEDVEHADGVRTYLASKGPVRDASGAIVGVYGISHDITERKRMETELRASRTHLQLIFDELNEGIVTCTPQGDLVYWNPTALEMHGFSSMAEVVGALSGFQDIYEMASVDGRVLPFHEWPLMRILRGETLRGVELCIRRLDGLGSRGTRCFSYSGCLARDSAGVSTIGILAIIDATERRESEAALVAARAQADEQIRALNADLERRVEERTAELRAANQELDSFAYAVSHDLRAPLRALNGFSQALQEDFAEALAPEARAYLDEIRIASRRMGALVDGLLRLSRSTRGGQLRREEVDLSALALAIRLDLERAEPARTVTWEIEPGITVNGDPTMLELVLRNLLDNAWKYTQQSPAPRVRLYREEDGAISISDNGAGFHMDHAERLFKPFQRLHRQEEFTGLGIGLATVQRILTRHGGTIRATASPGEGARFTLTLPASPPDPGAASESTLAARSGVT